ncbi:glutamyl-tRNA reductase [Rhodopirellula sp. MGV]|uniref:glutamyl-tRNA reductase n=1 Tax=Rhodopirellula sp. MGV TaxID=2023130 RepID=UPI000B97964B|nr:glutamyl-tRNA reductase [Rhodopirellula sp. MGV]OYP34932.1 glutamyl-tRNA reductase [Rhodopirellula sp. MGV]PNY38171.1 glutamyl-tRNA reductase [Rhodopirellula baltica]
MQLQMIGCSHHDSAVDFRERVAFTNDQIGTALNEFRRRFPDGELVLISTCNRTELYTTADDQGSPDRDAVVSFLAEQHSLPADDVVEQMIYRSGHDAIEHLFTVASSLDSMVIGESQILSQVKQAYELACQLGSAGPLTHAVFQAANHAAKRVHTETDIHRRRVSVPSVAVGEVIPEVFDSLVGKRVLICGAGEMGEETLRYLIQAGANNVVILNRSLDRAKNLAEAFGVQHAPWETFLDQVVQADVIVGTTSATTPILTAQQFESIRSRRKDRVLLALDLAVPRDFDAALDEFRNLYLYQIDDLQAACQRNRHEREKEWPKAQRIITEETKRLLTDLNHRATGPVIKRLREQAQQIKKDELERLLPKLELLGGEPALRSEIEKSLDRIINKLLHPPLASLKEDAAEGHQKGLVKALRELFRLD